MMMNDLPKMKNDDGSKQTGSAASPPAPCPALERGATTPLFSPPRSLPRGESFS
jgi:hypothetical protein